MVPRCCGRESGDVSAPKEHEPLAPTVLLRQLSPVPQLWLSRPRTHTCSPRGHAPTGPPLRGASRCRRPPGAGIPCQTAPSPPPPIHLIHLSGARKKRPRVSPWCCSSAALPPPSRVRRNLRSLLPVFLAPSRGGGGVMRGEQQARGLGDLHWPMRSVIPRALPLDLGQKAEKQFLPRAFPGCLSGPYWPEARLCPFGWGLFHLPSVERSSPPPAFLENLVSQETG